eukprot:1157763-Pelagomonas_calceolata.AAC.6
MPHSTAPMQSCTFMPVLSHYRTLCHLTPQNSMSSHTTDSLCLMPQSFEVYLLHILSRLRVE